MRGRKPAHNNKSGDSFVHSWRKEYSRFSACLPNPFNYRPDRSGSYNVDAKKDHGQSTCD